MARSTILWMFIFLCFTNASPSPAQDNFHEAFDTIDNWRALPADGVDAEISRDVADGNPALRVDYNFRLGGGFVVVRREVPLALAENYRFSFRVRGKAPANNLEFKLVDPSGDSVWWVNRRGFSPPKEWTTLVQRKRNFEFAWGPAEGRYFEKIGAIEFAIASNSGGKGTIWIDDLRYEPLPPAQDLAGPYAVTASSTHRALPDSISRTNNLAWQPEASDDAPWLEIDLNGLREIGGLRLDWQGAVPAFAVQVKEGDGKLTTVRQVPSGRSISPQWIPFSATDATALRVAIDKDTSREWTLQQIEPLDYRFNDSNNAMLSEIARAAPRGVFPRFFLGEQQFWTIVGVPNDRKEILFDEAGAVEVARGGFRIEPFLQVDSHVYSWNDADAKASLEDGYLPIPHVRWQGAPVELDITALATGYPESSTALVRYTLRNKTKMSQQGTLFLAIRPFQILPPWQALNLVGGTSAITRIERDDAIVRVDNIPLAFSQAPDSFAAVPFVSGEIGARILSGNATLQNDHVVDDEQMASASAQYAFDLAPQAQLAIVVSFPLSDELPGKALSAAQFDDALAGERDRWEQELNRVQPLLPAAQQKWVDTWRSTLAYILINADGPATQPGSRTYERSWIRDGAMTSRALLSAGEIDRVRDYIAWYSQYQFDNGKIPCVVDHRGPDPVDEHDSTGQYIFLIAEFARQTHDLGILGQYYDHVRRAVDYIDSLRHQRMTDVYRNGTPQQRACYGLVPESISHEGYSAKPMHSYWDDLWIARGLEDAVEIATRLGREDDVQRFTEIRDEFIRALHDSIVLAMKNTGVDYIPGCVELGDFDATSTAIAYFPCRQWRNVPQDALSRTFDKFYEFFQQRRGSDEWDRYTPYELRLMQTYVVRGEIDRAHQLADFYFSHQRPQGWNHWAEVVFREPRAAGFIGDMPHTWVGSAYMNALRSMLVYEDTNALILAAGIPAAWYGSGEPIGIRNAPTYFGTLTYSVVSDNEGLTLNIDIPPDGGAQTIVLKIHDDDFYVLKDDANLLISLDKNIMTLRPGVGEVLLGR